jgi:hypothetical protein
LLFLDTVTVTPKGWNVGASQNRCDQDQGHDQHHNLLCGASIAFITASVNGMIAFLTNKPLASRFKSPQRTADKNAKGDYDGII